MFTLEDAIEYLDKRIYFLEVAKMTNDINDAITELKDINKYLKAKEDENKQSNMYTIIRDYERKY